MIQELQTLLPKLLNPGELDPDKWDSLIVNRRRPHTYRVFRQFPEGRVCLHRFEPCLGNECFAHPHPWPGAFLMLKGVYVHRVGFSADLKSEPVFLYREIVRPYTMYEIIHKQTWHSVQPLATSYTVMLNGEPWQPAHDKTRTTKGKDLEKMPIEALIEHLAYFEKMLAEFIQIK